MRLQHKFEIADAGTIDLTRATLQSYSAIMSRVDTNHPIKFNRPKIQSIPTLMIPLVVFQAIVEGYIAFRSGKDKITVAKQEVLTALRSELDRGETDAANSSEK